MFIIYAIIIFLVLVFVHELGHFLTARAVGIRVKEFALGMGPKVFKKQKGETVYSLRAVPIGGFCAMEGEDEESDDPKAFNNKPARSRALVLVAGSLMNILFAMVLLIIAIFIQGTPSTTIKTIDKDSPAIAAGLGAGYTIVEIDGKKVNTWSDISVDIAGKESIKIVAKTPDGTSKTIETALYKDANGDYRIGISPQMKHPPSYILKSVEYGVKGTWELTKKMYITIGELFTGKVGMDNLTGPVGIVKAVDMTAKHGFLNLIELAAFISLNLGIVNLLPFPALDGGRIVFLIVRLFTGKRISDSFEGKFHLVGFALLIALMIYITVIDVGRFIIK